MLETLANIVDKKDSVAEALDYDPVTKVYSIGNKFLQMKQQLNT